MPEQPIARTYDEARRAECQWCAKGMQLDYHFKLHAFDDGKIYSHLDKERTRPCTAPTIEKWAASLVARIDELKLRYHTRKMFYENLEAERDKLAAKVDELEKQVEHLLYRLSDTEDENNSLRFQLEGIG